MLMVASAACPLFCSPSGPGTPFAPGLVVPDCLRVLCLITGGAVAVSTVPCVLRCAAPGQIARFGVFVLAVASAIYTEVEHLGDYASPRLYLNLGLTVLALLGNWSFLRHELPAAARHRPATGPTDPDPRR